MINPWWFFSDQNRPAFMTLNNFFVRLKNLENYLNYQISGDATLEERIVYILEVGFDKLEKDMRASDEFKPSK